MELHQDDIARASNSDNIDTIAQSRIYEFSFSFALAFFKKNGFEHNTAEDLSQEVAIKVLKKLSTLNDPGAFIAWLRIICKRLLINYIRRTKKIYSNQDFNIISDESESPSYNIILEELRKSVSEKIESLDPMHQELIFLFYYQGKNYKEISKTLGIPVGTIKSRLFKARKNFKETKGVQATYEVFMAS